jgi:hypothetical protein
VLHNELEPGVRVFGVPIVCILLCALYFTRRGRLLPLPVLPAVPLLLIPLCVQIVSAVMSILKGFQAIASGQTSGPIAVYSLLIDSQQSIRRVLEEIVCGLILMAALPLLRRPEPVQEQQIGGQHAKPWIAIFVALAVVMVGGLLWSFSDISHLIAMFIDPAQGNAVMRRFGDAGIAGVASYISQHLILQCLVSVGLIFVLLALGITTLIIRVAGRRHTWISGVLALLLLVECVAMITAGSVTLRHMRDKVAALNKDAGMQLRWPRGSRKNS